MITKELGESEFEFGVHFAASVTDPPHVLHLSNDKEPPTAPLQSTTNSAAAIANVETVILQVHVIELVADEYTPTTHDCNQRVPS
jgi:hypothetical protein